MERLGHAVHACVLDLLVDQERGARRALGGQDALQGIQPFMGFLGIGVVGAGCAENLLWYGGHDCLLGEFVLPCQRFRRRLWGLYGLTRTVAGSALPRLASGPPPGNLFRFLRAAGAWLPPAFLGRTDSMEAHGATQVKFSNCDIVFCNVK
ncbi:hypothetical protein D9M69_467230 [compost metagenome]